MKSEVAQKEQSPPTCKRNKNERVPSSWWWRNFKREVSHFEGETSASQQDVVEAKREATRAKEEAAQAAEEAALLTTRAKT